MGRNGGEQGALKIRGEHECRQHKSMLLDAYAIHDLTPEHVLSLLVSFQELAQLASHTTFTAQILLVRAYLLG